jgi:hypothetical protein
MQDLAPQLQLAEKYSTIEQLARTDPAALLDALGVDYDDLVTRKLGAKNPNARVEALEKKLADEEAAKKKAAEDAARQAADENHQKELGAVVQEARREGAYPELEAYDDDEVKAAVQGTVDAIFKDRVMSLMQKGLSQASAIERAQAQGVMYSEICAALNDALGEKHNRIEAARAKRKAPVVTPTGKGATKPPTTLTGQDATDTSQGARELSYAERKQLAEAALGNLLGGRLLSMLVTNARPNACAPPRGQGEQILGPQVG